METEWLTDDQQRAWRAYLAMHSRLVAALGRQVQATSGLSAADFEVLVHLSEAPGGRMRPFELQEQLDWGQSRLAHHLTRMGKRDLVRREECTSDGRGSEILVTDAGRRALAAAVPSHVDTVRTLFFDALSADQVQTLEEVARQVTGRLEAFGSSQTQPVPAAPAAARTTTRS